VEIITISKTIKKLAKNHLDLTKTIMKIRISIVPTFLLSNLIINQPTINPNPVETTIKEVPICLIWRMNKGEFIKSANLQGEDPISHFNETHLIILLV
jgi:hypothetical protein